MVVQIEQRTTAIGRSSGVRGDLVAGALELALVLAAVAVGEYLNFVAQPEVYAGSPPLFGMWLPHAGLASLFAVLIAVGVVVHGPRLAWQLRWGSALGLNYLATVGFTVALALVDGWKKGFADRLVAPTEYLPAADRMTSIPKMLAEYAARIPNGSAAPWPTHISAHPPGALLLFVWLDRIGLSGGQNAAFACIAVGCLVAVAVPATLHAIGSPDLGRAALPFVALFPGVVWIGSSPDALFAGITACGVALLALGAAGAHRGLGAGLGVGGGILLGYGIFCSYGLVLLAPLALVAVAWRRNWLVLAAGIAGALLVVGAFAAAGFWWYEGYELLLPRYWQGVGGSRSYGYWVWANLAALVLCAGPVLAPVVRRAVLRCVSAVRSRSAAGHEAVAALVLAAAFAVLVSTYTGLTKAEVERIWLPFAVWLTAGAVLLPPAYRQRWLAAQAVTVLLVNHVVLTNW